jgi:hypothetical protein
MDRGAIGEGICRGGFHGDIPAVYPEDSDAAAKERESGRGPKKAGSEL